MHFKIPCVFLRSGIMVIQGCLSAQEWLTMAKIALEAFYALPERVFMTEDQVEALAAAKKAGSKKRRNELGAEDFDDLAAVLL
jgi:hypothetical protein